MSAFFGVPEPRRPGDHQPALVDLVFKLAMRRLARENMI
jgi:hypothetical protein